jgi:hypothetical protein
VTATVCADGVVTPYLSRGRGPAVLIFPAPGRLPAELLGSLPLDRQWIALERPESFAANASDRISFGSWAGGILDALGLVDPWVVVDRSHAQGAVTWALQAGERLRGLAIAGAEGEIAGQPADNRDIHVVVTRHSLDHPGVGAELAACCIWQAPVGRSSH